MSVGDQEYEELDQASEGDSESSRISGPLGILFPADAGVWAEARKLAGDANVRVENLSTVAVQDPIIVMELLKVSNALYFSGGRSPITSPKTAIVRLGSEVVLETLEKINERKKVKNKQVKKWMESHRSRCRRTGIVARILSEALARNLSR